MTTIVVTPESQVVETLVADENDVMVNVTVSVNAESTVVPINQVVAVQVETDATTLAQDAADLLEAQGVLFIDAAPISEIEDGHFIFVNVAGVLRQIDLADFPTSPGGGASDAVDVDYTPDDPAHWPDPDPAEVQAALDKLAAITALQTIAIGLKADDAATTTALAGKVNDTGDNMTGALLVDTGAQGRAFLGEADGSGGHRVGVETQTGGHFASLGNFGGGIPAIALGAFAMLNLVPASADVTMAGKFTGSSDATAATDLVNLQVAKRGQLVASTWSASTVTLAGGENVFTGTVATTATLPARVADLGCHVKNRGTKAITVQRAGSDTLWDRESRTSIVVGPGDSVHLIADSAHWNVHRAPRVGGSIIRSGGFYTFPPHTNRGTLAAINQDRLFAIPFDVARALLIDRIGVETTVAATATCVMRFGIYMNDVDNDIPGALIYGSGTVAVDSGTGIREATSVATVIGPGRYWLACVAQVAAGPTVRDMEGSIPIADNAFGVNQQCGYFRSSVTGALPNPFGTLSGTVGSGSIPLIGVYVA